MNCFITSGPGFFDCALAVIWLFGSTLLLFGWICGLRIWHFVVILTWFYLICKSYIVFIEVVSMQL